MLPVMPEYHVKISFGVTSYANTEHFNHKQGNFPYEVPFPSAQ